MYKIETMYCPIRAIVYTFEGGFYTHIEEEITGGIIRLALLRCIASETGAVQEG